MHSGNTLHPQRLVEATIVAEGQRMYQCREDFLHKGDRKGVNSITQWHQRLIKKHQISPRLSKIPEGVHVVEDKEGADVVERNKQEVSLIR